MTRPTESQGLKLLHICNSVFGFVGVVCSTFPLSLLGLLDALSRLFPKTPTTTTTYCEPDLNIILDICSSPTAIPPKFFINVMCALVDFVAEVSLRISFS